MTPVITALLEKCEIYLDGALISKENLLEKYHSFFAESIQSQKKPTGFVLHTNNVCFDALSIVAVSIGCLSYSAVTIDDILATLEEDDYVIYKDQRYRWKGTEEVNGITHFRLLKDGVGFNSPLNLLLPYEEYKQRIKPYYGTAQKTNGVGVKAITTNREEFLAYILDRPIDEIPPQIDVAVVVACGRERFEDIFKRIRIKYNKETSVSLSDVLPASYYTDTDRPYQIGANPTKAEPVLKVTSNLSIARELLYDRDMNTVVGFLSLLDAPTTMDIEDLNDLLRANVLRFSYITAPIYNKNVAAMLKEHMEAPLFACTKSFLSQNLGTIYVMNGHTTALFHQVKTMLKSHMAPITVDNGITKDIYENVVNLLNVVRKSHWDAPEKDIFIRTAYSLLNLFTTAVFSMKEMTDAISEDAISTSSPLDRIKTLWNIADQLDDDDNTQNKCAAIADLLEQQYTELEFTAPKRAPLFSCVLDNCSSHHSTTLAIIVPKAYYSAILRHHHEKLFSHNNISCVTPAKFDPNASYELVISVGELKDKKYNPTSCPSATEVYTLLAPCEQRLFDYRRYTAEQYEHQLNARMGLVEEVDTPKAPIEDIAVNPPQLWSDLDDYLADSGAGALRRFAITATSADGQSATSEVTHIGTFTSGAQILFSRYYTAVVFDPSKGSIAEKKANALNIGDTLVFTKRDNIAKNIVDNIYEELLRADLLGEDAASILAKSLYWKVVLQAYKDRKGMSYSELALRLEECGTSLKESSIRQWLVEEAHIIGPQKQSTIESIATITKDPFLLADAQGYFEACGKMRSTRRRILDAIAEAIKAQLGGTCQTMDPLLEIVSNNVKHLSETMELEDIQPLDGVFSVKSSLVNRPIPDAEVTL